MAGEVAQKRPYLMRAKGRGGEVYLYYRRDGRTEKLPGPEGSGAFLAAYDKIHASFEGSGGVKHTVAAAIDNYVKNADFLRLADASRRHYLHYLNEVRDRAGFLPLSDIDFEWVDRLRNALAADPHRWNRIRDLMKVVTRKYARVNPSAGISVNPWEDAGRLSVGESDQNRAWPPSVLLAVLRDGTAEFRALVATLLLTGQRLSDVIAFRSSQYDPKERTLGSAQVFEQQKTGTALVLHVPDDLAAVFEVMRGRHPHLLLTTPRGKPWTTGNAQETLSGMRARLDLERYTLHGLRATGPTTMAQAGVPLATIMAVTGHKTETELRRYLKGYERYQAAKTGQEVIASHFESVIEGAKAGQNLRRFSGLTGRAAAKAGVYGQSSRPKSDANTANPVQNAKLITVSES